MLFSVIIPTFNRAALLRQALFSVFQQEFRDFEVIVVDDGSTEDIPAVVKSLDHPVTLVRQRNAGPGAARNRGISLASGQYVVFLDSDDLWFPWTLAAYSEVLSSEQRPAIIQGCGIQFSNPTELAVHSRLATEYASFADFYSTSRVPLWVGSGALAIRRDYFLATNGFCAGTANAEDLDLLLQMGIAKGFCVLRQPHTFGYRQHPGNSSSDIDRTLKGIKRLINNERAGCYPGGLEREFERLAILTRFVRPPSLNALANDRFRDAVTLYCTSLPWHVRLLRVKYLVGFWVHACYRVLRLLLCRASPGTRRAEADSGPNGAHGATRSGICHSQSIGSTPKAHVCAELQRSSTDEEL